MKEKWIYIPAAAGVICLVISFFVGKMGTLAGYVLDGCTIAFWGIFFLLGGICLGSGTGKSGKRDMKFTLGGAALGCVLLFFAGSNLVKAGMDALHQPISVQVTGCTVNEHSSLRRMFHSYYLEGRTAYGETERFKIDRDTYYQYYGQSDFTVEIVCWEHSGVVKEIH